MKSALLPQNDNTVIESLKQNVGRSVFDLSHSTTFPIDVDGAILPIACIETVPSDSFEISVECLLRQLSPLKVPPMARFQLNTAWFYCDNRLAWKKWDRFMTGGRSGNETYDIPKVANYHIVSGNDKKFGLIDKGQTTNGTSYRNIKYSNSLHTYFGISMNHVFDSVPSYTDFVDDSEELPVAFPFFDYQIICRDFYTDIDRLPADPLSNYVTYTEYDNINSDWAYSNLFPPDDDEIRLTDGIQISCGFQSGDDPIETRHGFLLDKVRYHNVREDYFTASKKAPMRGDIPTIDTTVAVTSVDASDLFVLTQDSAQANTMKTAGTFNLAHYEDQENSDSGISFSNTGITYETNSTDSTTQLRLINYAKEAFSRLKVSLETTKAINASELRLLSQLTVWQELNMLHKPYYQDFLNAHFDGVRVGESAVEKPIYIGGTSQNISINEILQTSASTESSALGTQGATAMSLANNYVGKIYCNNYGYIIGVAYIITDMVYNPAMPRGFSRRTKEEFYSPEFANLSMQAILNKEIFYSNDNDWNNTAWGYTGIFDELRSIPNHVAGDLLNNSYTDLKKWVIRREFSNDNKPAMNSTFLSLKGNVDKDNWSVKTMPAFMLQCANYIKAVRPMPYLAIPKAL